MLDQQTVAVSTTNGLQQRGEALHTSTLIYAHCSSCSSVDESGSPWIGAGKGERCGKGPHPCFPRPWPTSYEPRPPTLPPFKSLRLPFVTFRCQLQEEGQTRGRQHRHTPNKQLKVTLRDSGKCVGAAAVLSLLLYKYCLAVQRRGVVGG